MFEIEELFYKAHQIEFREKYFDKWLVIVGASLWGVYDTIADAAKNALQHFEPGEFMIHTPSHDGMVIEIGPKIHTRCQNNDDKIIPDCVITATKGELVSFTYA